MLAGFDGEPQDPADLTCALIHTLQTHANKLLRIYTHTCIHTTIQCLHSSAPFLQKWITKKIMFPGYPLILLYIWGIDHSLDVISHGWKIFKDHWFCHSIHSCQSQRAQKRTWDCSVSKRGIRKPKWLWKQQNHWKNQKALVCKICARGSTIQMAKEDFCYKSLFA